MYEHKVFRRCFQSFKQYVCPVGSSASGVLRSSNVSVNISVEFFALADHLTCTVNRCRRTMIIFKNLKTLLLIRNKKLHHKLALDKTELI